MIKNQKHASSVRKKLLELKTNKEKFISANQDNRLKLELISNSYDALIKDMEKELADYDSLITGNFNCLQAKSLEEISDVLIAARLAQKISQKELGDKLGIEAQQIQRYEATDYESASLERIVNIAIALNIKLYFEKIIIVKTEDSFQVPEGKTKDEIKEAEKKVKKAHCLII